MSRVGPLTPETGLMSDGAAADQRSRVGINAPATSSMAQADAWSGYYVIVNKARKTAFCSQQQICSRAQQPSLEKVASNYVRTTKYTFLTFLPLNLYSQFRRFYNLYFLASALIAVSMPEASPISPSTTVTPLVVVVVVTMIKDIFEDYLRYQADRAANNIPCTAYRKNGERVTLRSQDVRPGDILEVKRDEPFPADMILLASSTMTDGRCFVQTAQLDGETNLKRRVACFNEENCGTVDFHAVTAMIQEGYGRIDCDRPNAHLYRFEGRLDWVAGDKAHTFSLKPDNVLLRGATLKNTDKVLGAVVYVGNETKIMKNMVKSSLKFSTLQSHLNMLVVSIFVLNVVVLLVSSLLSGAWQDSTGKDAWYISWDLSGVEVAFYHAATYFVLWTYLIPISLFVSLEMVRLAQMFFMDWDEKMGTTIEGEWVPMKANSSNLNEDLGKIDHVFSDKTGTVTQNIMRLFAWVADDTVFSEEVPSNVGALLTSMRYGTTAEKTLARELITLAAVCNTVIPEVRNGHLIYDGDSPDELALVESLRLNGVTLTERTNAGITLQGEPLANGEEKWIIHNVLTFSSARKRMSVIASRAGSDRLRLFCKGADSVVLELLADRSLPAIAAMQRHIDGFARRGLRTLLLAQRDISRDELDAYLERFKVADAAVGNREARLAEVFASIEKNLELVGCTAVEDKLQDKVPETIAYLLDAGVRFWLLTGDKVETAISVGVSCRLLDAADAVVRIEHANSEEECLEQFRAAQAQLSPNRGLVIDGASLVYALDKSLEEAFLQMAGQSKSVICCRMSPQQKANVVECVRVHENRVTLAIGDGANDVGMILKADVGVGIVGREGTQAARASDYAIGEFRLLSRLLAVNGRRSHHRVAELINYSFYKNIAFIIVVFWFGFYSGWSGESIYQDSLMAAFNIFFTSLPPIMVGIFEYDVNDDVIEQTPQLYREVRGGIYFNMRNTAVWSAMALFHSAVAYFVVMLPLGLVSDTAADMRTLNLFFSTVLIFVVMGRMALSIKTWTWPIYTTILLSLVAYFALMYVVTLVGYAYRGSAQELFTRPEYYALFFLVFAATFMTDLALVYVQRTFLPFDWQIMQEAARLDKTDEEAKTLLRSRGQGDTYGSERALLPTSGA